MSFQNFFDGQPRDSLSLRELVELLIVFHQLFLFILGFIMLCWILYAPCDIVAQLRRVIFVFSLNFLINLTCFLYAGYKCIFCRDSSAIALDSNYLRIELQLAILVLFISFLLRLKSRRKGKSDYVYYFMYFIFVGNALLIKISLTMSPQISIISVASFIYLIATYFYISFVSSITEQMNLKNIEIEVESTKLAKRIKKCDKMMKKINYESLKFACDLFRMLKLNTTKDFVENDPSLYVDIEIAGNFIASIYPKMNYISVVEEDYTIIKNMTNRVIKMREEETSNIIDFIVVAFKEDVNEDALFIIRDANQRLNQLYENFFRLMAETKDTVPQYLWDSVKEDDDKVEMTKRQLELYIREINERNKVRDLPAFLKTPIQESDIESDSDTYDLGEFKRISI